MSSIPPYNPAGDSPAVWLLAADNPGQLPAELAGAPVFQQAVVATEDLRGAVAHLAGGARVDEVADPGGVLPESATLVAGPQAYVEAVLRELLGMPEGSARFAVLPGVPAVVQLLPDRAVLTRLNAGHALD